MRAKLMSVHPIHGLGCSNIDGSKSRSLILSGLWCVIRSGNFTFPWSFAARYIRYHICQDIRLCISLSKGESDPTEERLSRLKTSVTAHSFLVLYILRFNVTKRAIVCSVKMSSELPKSDLIRVFSAAREYVARRVVFVDPK